MNIEKFKDDHVAVMTSVTRLKELSKAGISENADAIAKTLVNMSAVIKLHLAAEDQYVYPTLAKSSDPSVAQMGKKYQDEMGGLATAYMGFVSRWNLGSKVSADPEGFRAEANEVLKALHQRIQKENQEFYPLVESIY